MSALPAGRQAGVKSTSWRISVSDLMGLPKIQFVNALSSGLSNFQPLVGPDGEIVQNCFVNRGKSNTLGLCGFSLDNNLTSSAQNEPKKGGNSSGQVV